VPPHPLGAKPGDGGPGRLFAPAEPAEPALPPAPTEPALPPAPTTRRSPAAFGGTLLRTEGRLMVMLVAGGLVVAALWRLLAPQVADSGNPLEAAAAVDGTLAMLGVVAGVVTAAGVLLWPGPSPVRRSIVAIVFSLLASAVSWQVGDLLGDPDLRATGAALVWPIITSAGLFAGALLPGTSRRLEDVPEE
jgi:hypothetical protein